MPSRRSSATSRRAFRSARSWPRSFTTTARTSREAAYVLSTAMRRLVVLVAVAVLAGCGGSSRQAAPPAPRFDGGVLDPARPAAEIALRDQDGRLVRLSSLRGKTVF